MANQVAVIYVDLNVDGTVNGGLKCRKAAWADVGLLSLDADQKYLAVHLLHQQADAGPPNSLVVNGHSMVSLKYTRERGIHPEKLDIKPLGVTPTVARQHTIEGNTQANNRQILNRVIPKDIAQAAAHDVSFILYDYQAADYDVLDSMATNFNVMDDTLCELLS